MKKNKAILFPKGIYKVKKTIDFVKFIDNPVQVRGFNAQKVVLPHEIGVNEWTRQRLVISDFKKDWAKKQKRAIWYGTLIGASIFSSWLGLMYALVG